MKYRKLRIAWWIVGVLLFFLLLCTDAATVVPEAERQRDITELVLAILMLISFWCAWFGIPRQFSLRTLLIVTTLVAIGLGLIVWLAAR